VGLTLAGLACSSGESMVVSQYFNAPRANDQATLTSFATVAFDQKVDDWKVTKEGQEVRTPAPLPELVKKQKEVQARLDEHTKEARAWANDIKVYPDLDKVRTALSKGEKVPAGLKPVADRWETMQTEDRKLKKELAEAKAAVEREKRNVTMSIGDAPDVETLTGEMISKDFDLELTIGGQPQPYTMTMRRYDLKGSQGGGRMMSRWVIQSLAPRA
jgi:hypothetical protein